MFTSAASSKKPVTIVADSKKSLATLPIETPVATAIDLSSEDPLVAAFYKSLTPAERIAHRIATVKLGTSYDVTRTRGFLAWSKSRTAASST